MPKKKKPPTSPTFSGGGTDWHPATSILFNLNPNGWGKKKKKPFKAKGPGIPGHAAGTWVGTGGAIYGTAASNWAYRPQEKQPIVNANLNEIKGGVGPYVAPVFATFQPARTIWEGLYLITKGVDPDTGKQIAPYGTQGTLRFGAGTVWMDLQQEEFDSNRQIDYRHAPAVFGTTPSNPFPTLPSNYTTLAPNRNDPRPAWLSWGADSSLDSYIFGSSPKAGMLNRWIPAFLTDFTGRRLSQWTPHVPFQ